ncbi:MAG: zinc ribbon domain-containing protein [Promethearchaeia archaeon]
MSEKSIYKTKCKYCGYEYVFLDKVSELVGEDEMKNLSIKDFDIMDINFRKFKCPECCNILFDLFWGYIERVYRTETKFEFQYRTTYGLYNPLIGQTDLKKIDRSLGKRFRNQWIDYFGIVFKRKCQIYSNIESEYLEDQNKLDSVSESFFSGVLNERIYEIYSPFLKKCEGSQIPKFYFLEKDEMTYIIIGVFLGSTTYNLVLRKMESFIENLIHNDIININNLSKTEKIKIQKYMKDFVELIERFLYHNEDPILLSILDKHIDTINTLNKKSKRVISLENQCGQCGAVLSADSIYCDKCGFRLKEPTK